MVRSHPAQRQAFGFWGTEEGNGIPVWTRARSPWGSLRCQRKIPVSLFWFRSVASPSGRIPYMIRHQIGIIGKPQSGVKGESHSTRAHFQCKDISRRSGGRLTPTAACRTFLDRMHVLSCGRTPIVSSKALDTLTLEKGANHARSEMWKMSWQI
jgi:hypothetical protein